ncbi:MAG: competence/damage-inducible protein A [candidate division Zixibacteria bacterium]|nr:competence/damage-inducible protein A [candidate division Zixibacteria bacterium]
MDVEIITIGDEVVTGHTVDTNSAFIARELTELGLTIKYKSSVGDSIELMEDTFRIALKRAHIVIATGGLGPTDDDLTKRAIVKVFRRNLIFHEEILDDIKARFRKRGLEMPALNQNQALLPQGAIFFPNKLGSAVGICIAEEGRVFIALPGVPSEMKQILTDEVAPYLRNLHIGQAIKVIKLRTTGIFESALAELIMPGLRLESGVRLAYLPSYSGVDLRIIATASDDAEARGKVNTVVKYLEAVCGKYIFGRDNDTLESTVGKLLRERKQTVAVAESCTGGQMGMVLTSVEGSSDYFLGGIMAYANQIKTAQLGVSEKILATDGAVSEVSAIAMAAGIREKFGSTFGVSITGIAGPDGGTEAKPVGTVFIGIATPERAHAKKYQFGIDREINRTRATFTAIELVRREILGIG